MPNSHQPSEREQHATPSNTRSPDHTRNQEIWNIVIGALVVCAIIAIATGNRENISGEVCSTKAQTTLLRLLLFIFPFIIILVAAIWPIPARKAAHTVFVFYATMFFAGFFAGCDPLSHILYGSIIMCPCASITLTLAAFISWARLRTR